MSEKKVKDGKIITQKDKNKDALEKAKKKIKDKNFNVFSGQIQKNKNVQTDVKKNVADAKVRKQKRLEKTTKIVNTGRPNENKRVLKRGNIVDDIGKVAALTPAGLIRKNVFKQGSKFIKNLFKKSDKKPKPPQVDKVKQPKKLSSTSTKTTGGGQGSGRFITQRKNRPTGTQITKPKNTQLKKPSRELVKKPNVSRIQNQKGPQQLANRAVVTSGLSELIKPKKSFAKTPKVEKKKKDFGLGRPDNINLKPSVKQGPPRGPLKPKPVKKKSRSNIANSSTYDADFTRKNLEKRGLKAKNFMSPKNFASTTKERERKIGIAGNFSGGGSLVGGQKKLDKNSDGKISGEDFKLLRSSKGMNAGGRLASNKAKIKKVTSGLKKAVKAHTGQAKTLSSIRLRQGGKVIKMRGGGAATRGMNFNRGY